MKKTEKEELDNYCNDFRSSTKREENESYKTKANFISSFFV